MLRNIVIFGGLLRLVGAASREVPPLLFVTVMLSVAVFAYWQIHKRDRAGIEVKPVLVLGFFLILFAFMGYARSVADTTGFEPYYQYVIDADKAMFGVVPSIWLQDRLYTKGSISPLDAYCFVIYFSYFAVPVLTGLALWHLHPRGFRVYMAATIFMIAFGTVTFIFLPTAPPWMASNEGYLPEVQRIGPQILNMIKGGVYEQGHEVVGVNNSAAFPSYHTAHTALVAVVIWSYAPRWRPLGVLYLASMCFALVYMGEHYVTDEVAGILIAAVGWVVALRVTPNALVKPAVEPIAVLRPTEERQAA